MFFSCPEAQLVWKLAPINWHNVENLMNFAIWWNDLFCNICQYLESIELLRLIVFLLWQMWKARNWLFFNGGTYEPNGVVNKVLYDLHKYDNVVNSTIVNLISNKIYDVTITLARNWVIVFTDAGLEREKEKASIRMATCSCGHLLMPLVPLFNLWGGP